MKKSLIIKVADGRVIKRDISSEIIGPLGAPANHEEYARICQSIAMGGYVDTDKVNNKSYVHIPPSQITEVSIKFE